MPSTGVSALDKLLVDGYPAGSAILVEGPSGNEKEFVAYSFLKAGLGAGEFCASVTRLPPSETVLDAKAFGIDFVSRPPYWLSPEGGDRSYSLNDLATISFGIKEVLKGRETKCSRVAIDCISQLLMLHSTDSVYRFLSQLLPELKRLNAVVIATIQGGMHAPQILSAVELLFDGVIEVGEGEKGQMELRMKKMRGVSLSTKSATVRMEEAGSGESQPANQRLAVLPFTNFSPDPSDDYLSNGLTEELISTLSKVDGLEVIARTSVMRYKNSPKPVREVADELNVGTILEGSTRRAGSKLRVAVQMIDARREKHLWAENYDRELEDVFAIQTEISQAVAQRVQLKFREEKGAQAQPKVVDPVAYDYYLKGRHLLNAGGEGPEEAVRYFRLAIEREPGLAKAYSGLADYFSYAADDTVPSAEAYPKAKEYAQKALALDPESSDAHVSLALISFLYSWDWPEAEGHFADSVRLNPSNAFAWHWRGGLLKSIGRLDEAMESLVKASELDPFADETRFMMALVRWGLHQHGSAHEECQRAIQLNKENAPAHALIGILHLDAGDRESALREAEEANRLRGDRAARAMTGYLYGKLGKEEMGQKILDELSAGGSPEPVSRAVILLGMGEKAEASEALQEAAERRSTYFPLLGTEPILEELADDPAFASLLTRVGLKFPPARPDQT